MILELAVVTLEWALQFCVVPCEICLCLKKISGRSLLWVKPLVKGITKIGPVLSSSGPLFG
jgi:hypothetical protein